MKRGVFDVIEGSYVACVVYELHRRGVFACLDGQKTVDEIAADRGYDPALLGAVLDFVYQTTDIVWRAWPDRYRLNPCYGSYQQFGFQLDKFIGAYGPALGRLDSSLRSAAVGRSMIDRASLAAAFSQVEISVPSFSRALIKERGVNSLLDLGCGPARLLVELGLADGEFRGWGIDESSEMCGAAVERIHQANLTSRVEIINGDVRQLGEYFGPELRGQVGALHGSSILNEFFGSGVDDVVSFLAELKSLFPGRLLFAVDYYGKLTRLRTSSRRFRHTLVQDLVQAISGQGVPPRAIEDWVAIYDAARCDLVHAYHGNSSGIDWFAHVVRL